ncbi:MAG: trifunctional transcriptional activator/DNA repair protein Ada/methylated-DNA--[protein]-cysteine S-methyltransferase [Acidobacteriota bacterium]
MRSAPKLESQALEASRLDADRDRLLYAALLARDESYDGRIFVAVTSTGIFCRLSCPAPKPRRENCRFFETAAACAEAGFRPCRRCHPVGTDPQVAPLLAALEKNPARRWSEADVAATGHDPSTVRRAFRRSFGMTFLQLARQRRIAAGTDTLAGSGRVIEAQLEAGFSSPSAFREAFARLLGDSPGSFSSSSSARLRAAPLTTPLGPMIALADESRLYLLEFFDRKALRRELIAIRAKAREPLGFGRTRVHGRAEAWLGALFSARPLPEPPALEPGGTPFQRAVWKSLLEIPPGETRSYSELAAALGRPRATRAVARANGANRIALLIPCHRVIAADGSLTGYGGGVWRKRQLIDLERRLAEAGTAR